MNIDRSFLRWFALLLIGLITRPAFSQSAKSFKERSGGKPASQPDVRFGPGSAEALARAEAEKGQSPKGLYEWGIWQAALENPDVKAATGLFRTAAEKGYAPAMREFGNACYYGRGIERNLEQAVEWYRKAAAAHDATAMHNLGVLYERGVGVKQDIDTAIKWYEQADEARFFAHGESLARLNRSRKLAADASERPGNLPISELEARAAKGDGRAMLELSNRYQFGVGVDVDDAKTLQWLKKAVERKHPPALTQMGMRCFEGRGLPKDEKQALALWKEAAELGDPSGIANVGYCYREGIAGLRQDRQLALDHYVKAAEKDEPAAMFNIGNFYRNGWIAPQESIVIKGGDALDFSKPLPKPRLKYIDNGTKDYANALPWLRRAAELDDADARNLIGIMYELGEGVESNPDIAFDWYSLAQNQSDAARKNLRRMALKDAFSAVASYSEFVLAPEDDPDRPKLGAIVLANSYYGQGGAEKDSTQAMLLHVSNTVAKHFMKAGPGHAQSPELGAIAVEIGNDKWRTDRTWAVNAYSLGLTAGEPKAAMNLGMLFGESDPKEAEKLYKQGEEMAAKSGTTVLRGLTNFAYASRSGPFVPARKPLPPLAPFKLSRPIDEIRKLAAEEDPGACCELALYLLEEKHESAAAFSQMKVAAEKGFPQAMYKLGLWYEIGEGTAIDEDVAREWYVKAAAAGEPDGYGRASILISRISRSLNAQERRRKLDPDKKFGELPDWQLRAEYLGKGAEQGSVLCMRLLAEFEQLLGDDYYLRPEKLTDTEKQNRLANLQKAVRWLRAASEKGDAESMRLLAWFVSNGYACDKDLDEAIALSKRAIEAGSIEAVSDTARYLLTKNTTDADAECVALLRKKIEADPEFDDAIFFLNWCMENGRGIGRDVNAAVAGYRRLAWRGHQSAREAWSKSDPDGFRVHELRMKALADANAKFDMAKAYAQGRGVPHEPVLATYWARQATYGKDPDLDHVATAAQLLAEGTGCFPLPERARKDLMPGVEKKHPRSMGTLGELLVFAKAFPVDDEKGLGFLSQAAEAGDVLAMERLGTIYRFGFGSPACAGLALDWWRKAAGKESIPAILAIGDAFQVGEGLPVSDHSASRFYFRAWNLKDPVGYDKFSLVAAKIFKLPDDPGFGPQGRPAKARLNYNEIVTFAQQGSPNPMFMLGRMYMEGIGHDRDVVKGKEWIEKAAKGVHSQARRYFAEMYRTGDGLKQDENFAKYWVTKALEAEREEKLRRTGPP